MRGPQGQASARGALDGRMRAAFAAGLMLLAWHRLGAQADSLVRPRPLSRPATVCAGGDVTLGTNLDPIWAQAGADTLWRFYGKRPDADSLAPALKPFLAGADVVLLNIEGA